jgi:hypothetical protein
MSGQSSSRRGTSSNHARNGRSSAARPAAVMEPLDERKLFAAGMQVGWNLNGNPGSQISIPWLNLFDNAGNWTVTGNNNYTAGLDAKRWPTASAINSQDAAGAPITTIIPVRVNGEYVIRVTGAGQIDLTTGNGARIRKVGGTTWNLTESFTFNATTTELRFEMKDISTSDADGENIRVILKSATTPFSRIDVVPSVHWSLYTNGEP